jgi:hypothetical protein
MSLLCSIGRQTWERNSMGVLMLKCPTTGREFSTGIHVEEDNFQKLPDTVTKAACPHCSQLHSCWTHDARLSELGDQGRLAVQG